MEPHVQNNEVVGLPEGDVTLFLAKMMLNHVPCYCAVFGPAKRCIVECGRFAELPGAKVALFDEAGNLDALYDVCHGHKYLLGGGAAEIDENGSNVSWTVSNEFGCSQFLNTRINRDDVFVAL